MPPGCLCSDCHSSRRPFLCWWHSSRLCPAGTLLIEVRCALRESSREPRSLPHARPRAAAAQCCRQRSCRPWSPGQRRRRCCEWWWCLGSAWRAATADGRYSLRGRALPGHCHGGARCRRRHGRLRLAGRAGRGALACAGPRAHLAAWRSVARNPAVLCSCGAARRSGTAARRGGTAARAFASSTRGEQPAAVAALAGRTTCTGPASRVPGNPPTWHVTQPPSRPPSTSTSHSTGHRLPR